MLLLIIQNSYAEISCRRISLSLSGEITDRRNWKSRTDGFESLQHRNSASKFLFHLRLSLYIPNMAAERHASSRATSSEDNAM